MSEFVLGLDLGTASIGWSLAQVLPNGDGSVIGAGVRSFEEPVEPKSREPKNAARRTQRGMRRNTFRRSLRRKLLRDLLTERGMLPQTPEAEADWLKTTDPYELRSKATTHQLTPQEFGRVLLHLVQRRGFLSNRKAKTPGLTGDPEIDQLIELDEAAELENAKTAKVDKTDEDGVVLKAIGELKKELGEAPSLGFFFAQQIKLRNKVRGRHTLRTMFEDEFNLIWSKQAEYKPQLFSDSLKLQVHQAIFFQRPLRVQTHLISKCRLEPAKNAVPKTHYLAQQFRIWQTLSDIELTEIGTWQKRKLTLEEKAKAFATLNATGKMTWPAFRKLLGLPDAKKVLISHQGRKGLENFVGNFTEALMLRVIGDDWLTWEEEKKDLLMEVLFYSHDERVKLKRLKGDLGLTATKSYQLAKEELPRAIGAYSAKALKKLIAEMKKGLDHTQARTAAGYTQIWEKEAGEADKLNLNDIPEIRNPGVKKIVHETRKVVNAIIREYGKPDVIRVELGRDVAQNDEERLAIQKGQKRDEQRNAEAREKFKEFHPGSEPSRWDLKKYRLFVECKGICPYTGRTIELKDLWTKSWEIEHIIPYSISLDDSMSNLTLCPGEVNAAKGQRLPIEYFGENTEEWNQAQQRVWQWSCGGYKKKKFGWTRESIKDDFLERQLNDTRYAARLVKDYLGTLGVKVQSTAGRHTAILRKHWGLHTILNPEGKMRDDHRHHAVDALVVALTSPSLVKKIADLARKGGGLEHADWTAPAPWPKLRQQAEKAIAEIIVSHEPTRRIRGALHEETGYGFKPDRGFTTRKALASMTPGEASRIIDKKLRARMEEHLAQYGGDPKKAFTSSDALQVVDKNGVIYEVKRALIKAQKQNESSYMQTSRGSFPAGANHWCLIIQKVDAPHDRTALIIPLWQAVKLKHNKQGPEALVPEGWVLVAALCKNDMVELVGPRAGIYRVRKFSVENPVDLHLEPHERADDTKSVRLRTQSAISAEFFKSVELSLLGKVT